MEKYVGHVDLALESLFQAMRQLRRLDSKPEQKTSTADGNGNGNKKEEETEEGEGEVSKAELLGLSVFEQYQTFQLACDSLELFLMDYTFLDDVDSAVVASAAAPVNR
jgi:hypothetical protein